MTPNVAALVGGSVDLANSDLTITAASDVTIVTSASPAEDGSNLELGLGVSVALAIVDVQTSAAIADGATLIHGDALTITASAAQTIETKAVGGAEATGSTAKVVTPVVAITLVFSDAKATIGSNATLSLSGDVGVDAVPARSIPRPKVMPRAGARQSVPRWR